MARNPLQKKAADTTNADKSYTPSDLLKIIDFYNPKNDESFDEVYPRIFLGDGRAAQDLNLLRRLGITHMINACYGENSLYFINTNADTYRSLHITFMGIPAIDMMTFDLSQYFRDVSEFIDSALKGGGKVFVHCMMGVSRSATLVVAYLMLKQHMTAADAIRMVRKIRAISPNDGFLEQLCKFNEELRLAGHFSKQ